MAGVVSIAEQGPSEWQKTLRIRAFRLSGAEPLSKPIIGYC